MSKPEVFSQHLCFHEGSLKGGDSVIFFPILCFLEKPCLVLSCSQGSVTKLLHDFRQISFHLWNSMFPSGNRPCAGHSDGTYFSSVTFNSSILNTFLPPVSHWQLTVLCNRSIVNVDEYIIRATRSLAPGVCQTLLKVCLTLSFLQNPSRECSSYCHLTEEYACTPRIKSPANVVMCKKKYSEILVYLCILLL